MIYSPAGVSTGIEFFPSSPAIVVVDTEIIAAAPERYLVAGMGDAMATWYEARACLVNPAGVTMVGARPTLASCAIGEVCAQTLFKEGRAAAMAVAAGTVDASLETVVAANTLLSGLGFESGGLAAARGMAQSFTAIPKVHANYLQRRDGGDGNAGALDDGVAPRRGRQSRRVLRGRRSTGAPRSARLDAADTAALGDRRRLARLSFIYNMPPPVTADRVRSAVLGTDELGRSVAARQRATAYETAHRPLSRGTDLDAGASSRETARTRSVPADAVDTSRLVRAS